MSHTHPVYGTEAEQKPCVDLGSGVCIREWRYAGDRVGSFFIAHERNRPFDAARDVGDRCEGRIPVRPKGEPQPDSEGSWEMTGSLAAGDLTLTPSILCGNANACGGSHGFVQNGKWVPA